MLELMACDCRSKCGKGLCLGIDKRIRFADSCRIDSFGNMQNNDEDESNIIKFDGDGEYDNSDIFFDTWCYLLYNVITETSYL